ncbi:MAG: peptidoglycan synthetase FtsI, partial [Frankiales bacterium]|nr:peptidoglycan synthetase FtsI [Frankiales bacterium]
PARGATGIALGRPIVRLRSGMLIVLVLLGLIGVRLVWLQGFQGQAYADQAVEQRLKKVELQAPRGTISDRNGQALAMSVDARAIYAEPRNIAKAICPPTTAKPCTPAGIAAALAPVLSLPVAEIEEKLTRTVPGEGKTCSPDRVLDCTAFVYLARGLEAEVANEVRALGLVGVGTDAEPKRVHPGKDVAANVIGFTTVEGRGAGGMELQWDDVLSGVPGERVAEVDGGGRVIPSGTTTIVEPKPGRDIQLTLDRDLQWYAQQVLMKTLQEKDAESGSATVMDVRTGEVLALASVPTFDADEPGRADAAVRGNRAVTDVFEPGSIGKAITVAAVLEDGAMTPDSVLAVPDRYRLSNKTFKDSHDHPTEQMTLTGVLVESSNVGTIMAAQKIGGAKLHDMLERFGIGQKTGIGLPGEGTGRLRDEDTEWSGTDYGTHPIGQGYSVNGVKMASVYATIANDGVMVTPTVIKSSTNADGEVVPARAPKQQRIISSAVATQLRGMLEGVTNEGGTAVTAAIDGYRVAGKTGTAQRVVDGRYDGSYTASFVGFAPADAPRLAVSVSIQAPKNGYYGGLVAGPPFRDIMGFALTSLGVPPTGAPSPRLRLRAGD